MALTDGRRSARRDRPSLLTDLLERVVRWFEAPVDVGLVETAGGLRSPIADDGDCRSFVQGLAPDVVVLVADAGLGTINVRCDRRPTHSLPCRCRSSWC